MTVLVVPPPRTDPAAEVETIFGGEMGVHPAITVLGLVGLEIAEPPLVIILELVPDESKLVERFDPVRR